MDQSKFPVEKIIIVNINIRSVTPNTTSVILNTTSVIPNTTSVILNLIQDPATTIHSFPNRSIAGS